MHRRKSLSHGRGSLQLQHGHVSSSILAWCQPHEALLRAAVVAQNTVPALTEHWRQVVYACYQPRCFAREEDLRLKSQAWEEYRVTTHWPARNVHLFPKSQPGKGVSTWPVDDICQVLKPTLPAYARGRLLGLGSHISRARHHRTQPCVTSIPAGMQLNGQRVCQVFAHPC